MKNKIEVYKIRQAIKKIEYGKNNPEKGQFYFNSDLMINGLRAKLRQNKSSVNDFTIKTANFLTNTI